MDKKSLRQKHRGQRIDSAISVAIAERIRALTQYQQAEKILLYYPLPDEVDVRPLLEDTGKKIYLPFLRNGDMFFSEYTGVTYTGTFNLECATGEVLLDFSSCLMVVPALSFDRKGYRLGRGKGYYDRFLAYYPHIETVGVQAEEFLEESIPHEEHDIPMQALITEKALYRF